MTTPPAPPGDDPAGGGGSSALDWQKVGALVGIAALVVSVITFGIAQCAGSNGSPNRTAAASTTIEPNQSTTTSFSTTSPSKNLPTSSPTASVAPSTGVPVALFSSGSVRGAGVSRYEILKYKEWDRVFSGGQIISNEQQGITGNGGTLLVPLPTGQRATYETCRAQSYIVAHHAWQDVPSGTEVCLLVGGRVGSFVVTYKFDRDGYMQDLTLAGQVWEPQA